MKATIEVRYPDNHTEQRTLEDEQIVIGRGEVDVTLADPKVSGRHAELSVANNRVVYTDLKSTNGSAMDDGTPISGAVVLLPGQGVVLGSCRVGLVSVELAPAAGNTPAPDAQGKNLAFAGTIVANPGLHLPAAPAPAQAAPAPAAAAPAVATPTPAAAAAPAPAAPAAAAPAVATPTPAAAAPPPAVAAPEPAPTPAVAAPRPASEPPAASAPAATPAPAAVEAPATPTPAPASEPAPAAQPGAASDNVWNDAGAAADSEDANAGEDAAPWSIATAPAGTAADESAPQGIPVGKAGEGMKDFGTQLKTRLTTTWKRLEPHAMIIGKFVALVTVPFALVQVVLGFIPVVGLLLAIPLSMLEGAAISLFVSGVVADYTLKVHRGEQASVSSSIKAHMTRIVPWAITLFIAGIMGFIGFFLFIIPAIMVSWATVPAFMVEDRRMVDAPMRSARLFMKDWLHVLQMLAVGIIGMFPIYIGLMFISAVPGIRILAPLVSAVAQGFLIPFGMLYAYGTFFETRRRIENAGLPVS